MSRLYIIGNGFDLYHGLPSRYADFHRHVEDNDPELLEQLDSYFDFKVDENYLWSNFEQDLCHFDHGSFKDNFDHIDVTSETFKLSEFYGLEDEVIFESESLVEKIRDAFSGWVETFDLEESTAIGYKPIKLDPEAFYINFNYTDTLEEVYQIPKERILYIHNNAKAYDDLIFGHGETTDHAEVPTFDEQGEPTRTPYTDIENASRAPFFAFQKDTKSVLKKHRHWFSALIDIREVIILGHSLGNVDAPYFRQLVKQVGDVSWKVSYYGMNELTELHRRARSLNRRGALQMVTFNELK